MSKGVVSENDLMSRLVQAKKVMNKVDNGDYQTGFVDTEILREDPEKVLQNMGGIDSFQQPMVESTPAKIQMPQTPTVDRIKNSKLPDAIKKAMIDNPIPIPQISLNENIDMNIINGAKRLMEKEGLIGKKPTPQPTPQPRQQPQPRTIMTESVQPSTSVTGVDLTTMTVLIENIIRKVLDEKLTQILNVNSQQTTSINENLVLKVGDSVFKGKITGVNKSK